MRKIKYVVYCLFFSISLIILGELFVYNLESFYRNYISCTFAVNQISDLDIAKKDFEEIAYKNSLGIFIVDNRLPNEKLKEFHIYGNERAIVELQNTYKTPSVYRSLVAGETKIIFHSWDEFENVDLLEHVFFSNKSDDLNNARNFKKELIDKYGGGFPRDDGESKILRNTTILVLFVVYLVLLLNTLFELQINKKENYVRLIQGEDITKNNVREFLEDQIFLVFITLLVYFVLDKLYFLTFLKVILLIAFIVQLSISLFFYIRMAKYIETKGLNKVNRSSTVIKTTYAVRLFVMLIMVQLIYSNGLIIKQGLDYGNQRSFFESNKDYSYYQLNYRIGNSLVKDVNNTNDTAKLHKYLNDMFYSRSLLMFNFSKNVDGLNIILANKNALEKQKVRLPFDKVGRGVDLVVFYKNDLSDFKKEQLEMALKVYYPSNISFKYNQYIDKIDIIAINDSNSLYRSNIFESPVVIYETHNIDSDISKANARLYFSYSIPYHLTQEEFNEIINKFDLENQITKKTNILETYLFELKNIQRSITFIVFITILFVLLNFLILSFIVRIQYILHRKGLVLKTILGYGVIEKNRKILLIQGIILIFALITSLFGYVFFKVLNLKVFVILTIMLIIIETVSMIVEVSKNEKLLLSHVLKGGQ